MIYRIVHHLAASGKSNTTDSVEKHCLGRATTGALTVAVRKPAGEAAAPILN
jgi:hypothetical protein